MFFPSFSVHNISLPRRGGRPPPGPSPRRPRQSPGPPARSEGITLSEPSSPQGAPEPAQQPQGQPQGQQQQRTEIVLDDKQAHAAYANFARVTATPEEVIIDFALNPNPFMAGRQEVIVSQRLIMNFFTAKRLFGALLQTLQRHEQTFGQIELDVRRRAQPQVPPMGGAAGS